MLDPSQALASVPLGLRTPLLLEYERIIQNFMERRWLPSELSGGRFCEIVFTILDGYGSGKYALKPAKPKDFAQACRRLESNTNVPRSFQILIPRILPTLYEIRNNRGVGHVGGDVDPNHMDATAVVSMVNWVMAELIRVFHKVDTRDAQRVVDLLVERRIPAVWKTADVRRVLDTTLDLTDQILLLVASCANVAPTSDLFAWTEYGKRGYFDRLLRRLHKKRFVELSADAKFVTILPPGSKHIEERLISRLRRNHA